jgi:hypothetical protein
MKCKCASEYRIILIKPDIESYTRVKRILNRGQHPAFIGKRTVGLSANNGGVLVFNHNGKDVAVAILNTRINSLIVLNVIPEHRKHGLGAAIINYCKPTWIRALSSVAPYFEKLGYTPIGKVKQGRKLATQIMVRKGLIDLSGRLAGIIKA